MNDISVISLWFGNVLLVQKAQKSWRFGIKELNCAERLSSSSSMMHTWYCYKTKFFLGKALRDIESIVSNPHIFPHACLGSYANILYNWRKYWIFPLEDWNSGWPSAGAQKPPQATSPLCYSVQTRASAPSPRSWRAKPCITTSTPSIFQCQGKGRIISLKFIC